MLSEPNISYKPFWGICRPLNSWRANSPNPIQIYCANKIYLFVTAPFLIVLQPFGFVPYTLYKLLHPYLE